MKVLGKQKKENELFIFLPPLCSYVQCCIQRQDTKSDPSCFIAFIKLFCGKNPGPILVVFQVCVFSTSLGFILSLKKKWGSVQSRCTVSTVVISYGLECIIVVWPAAASADKSSGTRLSLGKECLIKGILSQPYTATAAGVGKVWVGGRSKM